MSRTHHSLPKLAVGVLAWTVPADWRSDIVRDLEEEISQRRADSRRFTTVWLWMQISQMVVRFLFANIADAFTRGGVSRNGWALDFNYAVRSIKRRPWASLMMIVTLALAIGATTSVYTVIDGVLLRPLPYQEPAELTRVWEVREDWLNSPNLVFRASAASIDPTAPTYFRWLEDGAGFEELGAYIDTNYALRTSTGAQAIRGQEATSGFFRTLGLEPLIGRGLQEADDPEGAPRVVVLSEAFWRDRFSGSHEGLGSVLNLDGEPHTIVGVMPSRFGGHPDQRSDSLLPPGPPQLWTQLGREARTGWKSIRVIGRLSGETSLRTARARLHSVQQQIASERSAEEAAQHGDRGVRVVRLLDSMVGDVRSTLWFLLAVTGLVLLVATVNIANILTARGLERRRELAVRSALGAAAGRLVRGQLVESMVLVTLGGAAGVATAWALLPVLLHNLPPGLPRTGEISMNFGVLACGLAATTLTAILAGTLPAVLATRTDPQEAMRTSTRSSTAGPGASRVRSALVAIEVALAFVLLVGAGLLSSSYSELWSQERGFDPSGIAAMWIEPDWALYREDEAYYQLVSSLDTQFNAEPNIEASACNNLPLSGLSSGTRITLENEGNTTSQVRALLSVGLPNYREIMRIPLRQGRDFTTADTRTSQPVAMVNETMARNAWPNQNPIGQRIKVDSSDWREIVGVVADSRHAGLAHAVDSKVYLTANQSDRTTSEWVFRVSGDTAAGLARAKEILAAISPTSTVTRELILESTIADSVAIPRFRTLLVVGLAGLAALLALLGVYGMLTFAVTQRSKEIGVRIALGARSSQVIGRIVASGLTTALVGIAAGIPIAWLAADSVAPFLFRVAPNDPLTHLLIICGLLLTTVVAASLPARRAASVNPVNVLGDD